MSTGILFNWNMVYFSIVIYRLIWDICFVRETGKEVARIYTKKTGIDIHRREHWGEFFHFMAKKMYLLERNFLEIADYLRE